MSEQVAVQSAASIDESATSEIRATAKWLCASAGAVVAALVAGLQFSDLHGLDGMSLGAALAGASVALLSVLVVLLIAASVLASEGPSIQSLSNADKADGGAFPRIRVDEPKTPLMKYLLVERRLELLGPRMDSISGLIVARVAAHDGLTLGKTVEIDGRTYSPSTSEADRTALRAIEEDIQARITAVLNAADRWTVNKRFKRLRIALVLAGAAFSVGLVVWVAAVAATEPRAEVTKPHPATILVPSDRDSASMAGFDAACAGKTLSGVVVGGWLDEPAVVTESSGACPAHKLIPRDPAIVVPMTD